MHYKGLLTLLLTLSFCACSGGQGTQTKAGDHGEDTIWKEQTRALDKAHHVNQMVQQGANREKRAIQAQSK